MAYDLPDGTPSWVDLATLDLKIAKKFYSDVLGWEYNEFKDENDGMVYTAAKKNGRDAAGLYNAMPGQPSAWNTYIKVSNIEEYCEKVKVAGGSIVKEPFNAMDAGTMAVCQDDQGAYFNLWEDNPDAHDKGNPEYNKPGFYSWAEYAAKDVEKAKKFYGDVFGWKNQKFDDPKPPEYFSFTIDGKDQPSDNFIGGTFEMTSGMPDMPPHWTAYFSVENYSDAKKAVEDNGGKVMMENKGTAAGDIMVVQDPTGAFVSLIQIAQT